MTLSVISKTAGSGDVLLIEGVEVPVPGEGVTTVS